MPFPYTLLKFFRNAIAQKILRSGTELRNLSRSSEQRWLWRVEHIPLKPHPNQQWGATNSQPLCPYDKWKQTHITWPPVENNATFRDESTTFHQASSLKPGLECSTTANCSFMATRCCWMGPKLRPAWRCMSSNMLVTWRVFRPGKMQQKVIKTPKLMYIKNGKMLEKNMGTKNLHIFSSTFKSWSEATSHLAKDEKK